MTVSTITKELSSNVGSFHLRENLSPIDGKKNSLKCFHKTKKRLMVCTSQKIRFSYPDWSICWKTRFTIRKNCFFWQKKSKMVSTSRKIFFCQNWFPLISIMVSNSRKKALSKRILFAKWVYTSRNKGFVEK